MEFQPILEEDTQEIIEHLRKYFFVHEPLNELLNIAPDGKHEELEHDLAEVIKEGYSIKCVENGNLLGISINGLLKKGDIEIGIKHLPQVKCQKYKKILSLILSIKAPLDIFNKHQVEEIMQCKILSVVAEAREKGIASQMIQKVMEMTKQRGLKVLLVECTDNYSRKACENNGITQLHSINYKDYVDKLSGKREFEHLPPPHEYYTIMLAAF